MPPTARDLRLPAAVVAAVVVAVLLRAAVAAVGDQVVAGNTVRGFWAGAVLAGIAWVPSAVALFRRARRDDRWFYVAVAWGVLAVAAVAVPGGGTSPDVLGPAPSWLLTWTVVFWTSAAYVRTRRRAAR